MRGGGGVEEGVGMSEVCDFCRMCMVGGQLVADFLNLSARTHHLTLNEW